MHECNPCRVPIRKDAFINLGSSSSDSDPEHKKRIPYQQAIGSIMYIFQATRPDLAYAISTLSRFNNSFEIIHWQAVKSVFRYLQVTRHKNLKLCYSKSNNKIVEGFCDASFSKNIEDPRPVAGYVFTSQGGAVSWYSKRIKMSSLSTVEAELLALSVATQEAIWLKDLACDLNIISEEKSIPIFSDSQGAIQLAKNGNYSPKTKHIIPKYNFVKDYIHDGTIT